MSGGTLTRPPPTLCLSPLSHPPPVSLLPRVCLALPLSFSLPLSPFSFSSSLCPISAFLSLSLPPPSLSESPPSFSHSLSLLLLCPPPPSLPLSLSPPPNTLYSLEQQIECPHKPEASAPFPARTEAAATAERPAAGGAGAVDGIDLAKIGSILNSLSSVMKTTGERPPVCWSTGAL